MLLNLSNHKSSTWPPEQLDAARQQYHRVEDLEFPHIDPHATREQVNMIAIQYLEAIEALALLFDEGTTVHIMGEMTFCFALCTLLKAKGISVVASTTHRIAIEKDGVKTSTFQFVQFREY